MVQLNCAHCGKSFQAYPSQPRQFCSKRCFYDTIEPLPVEEKFWAKVDKTPSCWIWTAATNPKGYGRFCVGNNKVVLAHRYSWILKYGEIPNGLYVCHDCRPAPDNRRCVNWQHLFLGTQLDNIRDALHKGTIARGESNARSKLTEHEVQEIRTLYSTGEFLMKEIGQRFGVTQSAIQAIISGVNWKHLPPYDDRGTISHA